MTDSQINVVPLNKYPIILPKHTNHIETPEHEVKLHGIFVVCGKRGSGKSVAVASKLRHLKQQKSADRIFLVSPTAVSNTGNWNGLIDDEDIYPEMDNKSIEDIKDKVIEEAKEWEEYMMAKKLYDKFVKSKRLTDEFLLECLDAGVIDEYGNPIEPQSKYGHRPVLHMVLDDCQSSKLFVASHKNSFLNLCIRHRHIGQMPSLKQGLGVSIWVLIQNYSTTSGLPKAVRGNCTNLILFKIQDDSSIEKIMKECGGEVDKDTFLKVYKFATKEPHDFLAVDFNPKKKEYMFRRNWDTLVIPNRISHDDYNNGN